MSSVTHDSVTLSWKAGKSDKTTPVSEYVIESLEGDVYAEVMTMSGDVTTATIDDLVEGREYDFRVVSRNAAGTSESAAELKSPVTPKSPFGTCRS